MLALKQLKKDPQGVATALLRRNHHLFGGLSDLLSQQTDATVALQNLLQERNEKTKKIGELMRAGGDTAKDQASELRDSVVFIKKQIDSLETSVASLEIDINNLLTHVPNIPDASVPLGTGEEDNVMIERWVPSGVDLVAKDTNHADLGPSLGIDFESGVSMSGSRFTVLRNQAAVLHRALGQFMLDLHVNSGYEECYVPVVVDEKTAFNTGQLPKFKEDMYGLTNGQYMIPTGEVPLTNLVAGKLLRPEELPMKLTALTPCFRSEAGSAGRDVRGLIRQHQFDKVELVRITTKDESQAAHSEMLEDVRRVLVALRLPYRVMLLCGGDMGFSAQKTYDFEVWMPSQNTWREISSVSNCGDFQARRMMARVKGETSNELVHTLNGSGVAVGRALAAVIENHTVDGELVLPEVLREYIPASSKRMFKFQ